MARTKTPAVKPQVWTNPNGDRFVVLPEADFVSLTELLEDAADLRDLRKATKANAGKKYHLASDVERQLAASRRGK